MWIVALLLLLLQAPAALAQVAPQPFVKGVQLGMTLEALDKARPDLQRFTLGPGEAKRIDTKNPKQMLTETLNKSLFFSRVVYFIQQGRLDGLGLLSALSKNVAKRDAFLAQAVRLYGEPTHFLVAFNGPEPGPTVAWKRGEELVSASFSQWNASPKLIELFALKMMIGESADLERSFAPISIPAKEQEAILAPLKASVTRLLCQPASSPSGQ